MIKATTHDHHRELSNAMTRFIGLLPSSTSPLLPPHNKRQSMSVRVLPTATPIRLFALFRWLPCSLSMKELLLWRGNMGRDEDYHYHYHTSKSDWQKQQEIVYQLAIFVRHHFDHAILASIMDDWSTWAYNVRSGSWL